MYRLPNHMHWHCIVWLTRSFHTRYSVEVKLSIECTTFRILYNLKNIPLFGTSHPTSHLLTAWLLQYSHVLNFIFPRRHGQYNYQSKFWKGVLDSGFENEKSNISKTDLCIYICPYSCVNILASIDYKSLNVSVHKQRSRLSFKEHTDFFTMFIPSNFIQWKVTGTFTVHIINITLYGPSLQSCRMSIMQGSECLLATAYSIAYSVVQSSWL